MLGPLYNESLSGCNSTKIQILDYFYTYYIMTSLSHAKPTTNSMAPSKPHVKLARIPKVPLPPKVKAIGPSCGRIPTLRFLNYNLQDENLFPKF